MIKLYREHPEFDAFSKFDTKTGKLITITQQEFEKSLLDSRSKEMRTANRSIQRIENNGTLIFQGITPETHTRFPRRIYFQITRKCNLSCDYCFIKADKNGAHVPTKAAMTIAEYLGQNGLIEVRLTGGEPTLHTDFLKIVEKFQEQKVYVSIATNGIFNQNTLDQLSTLKNLWIICSIDGNRETHNRYRPGTFDIIIKNLKYLKNRNPELRIRLNTVLTEKNKDQMFDLGLICKEVDAESITVIPLRPQLRHPWMKKEMVSAKTFRTVIERLVEAKEKLNVQFTTTIETEYSNNILKDPIFRKRSSCAAGREGTNLDYDFLNNRFIVYGCSYSPASDLEAPPEIRKPFLAGQFSSDEISFLGDIWNDDSRWELFRNLSLKSNACKSCNELSKRCTGSCPIQNLDFRKIDVNVDVQAQLVDQMKKTGEWYCYKKYALNRTLI